MNYTLYRLYFYALRGDTLDIRNGTRVLAWSNGAWNLEAAKYEEDKLWLKYGIFPHE